MKKDIQINCYTSKLSSWISCQSINKNFRFVYSKLNVGDNYDLVLDSEIMQARLSFRKIIYLSELCESIGRIKAELICFIEWGPWQLELVSALRTHPKTKFLKIKYLFHVYSDLVLFSNLWLKISEKLIGEKVKLLLASEREAKVAKKLLAKSKGIVEYCPFPVDVDFFSFDPTLRKNIRHRLGLNDDDRLIIYTGRISLQKNVDILIKQFEKISNMCTKNVFLYIVGSYDDYGADVLGLYTPLGWYYNKIDALMSQLPKNISSKIKILNFQTPLEIKGLLNASDLFWSLSLHHNENFGMSVAEALSCGLPCVVTNWAGYSSFAKKGLKLKLIEVQIGKNNGFLFKESQFITSSLLILEREQDEDLRYRSSVCFQNSFSSNQIIKNLNKIINSKWVEFSGFNSRKMLELIKRIYIDLQVKSGTFYESIYFDYIKNFKK